MEQIMRVLLVEDDPNDAAVVKVILSRKGREFKLEVATNGEKALEMMRASLPDIVLLDYNLPGMNGLAVLEQIHRNQWALPVVILTGVGDELIAAEAIKQGADDYMVKDDKIAFTLVPLMKRLRSERVRANKSNEAYLPGQIYLLYVEDNPRDAEFLEGYFAKYFPHIHITASATASKAMGIVKSGVPIDCALVDLRLPEIDGLRLMDETRDAGYEIPFVVITGAGSEESAVAAMKQGAYDYIAKRDNYVSTVPYAIQMAVMKFRKDRMNRTLQRELSDVNASLERKVEERTATLRAEVAERKRAEDALRESEGKFRTLVQNIPQKIFTKDRNSVYLSCNRNFARDLHITPEELVGKTDYDFFPEDLANKYRADDNRIMEVGKAEEMEERYIEEGHEVWVQTIKTPIRDDHDHVVGILGIFWDITERKRAQEALKESEERYRQFFEDDLTGDYVSTPEGKIISCNPAYARMFGFASAEDAMSSDTSTLFAAPGGRETFLRELREKKRLDYRETEYLRRDGSPAYCIENAIGIFDSQGNLGQIRGYILDESQRKLLERQLVQAQKLESLGTLASGIAHDFNNILGIIMGHSTLLDRFKENPERISESIEAIIKATERGASLVKQLLTFARKKEPHLESVNINDMIREINKLMQETFPRTITISMCLQQDLPTVVADPSQIHQVLLNLCVNARDAMPQRGTLSIATRSIDRELVSPRFVKAARYAMARRYVQIEVADTGVGMDEATRQRIFEPFFTTKAPGKGTGLGLAVVFGIIETHNGFIDVRSEPGEGTSFTVYLPIAERAPEGSPQAAIRIDEIAGGTETILLIEDEEMLKEFARVVLVSKGYKVITAENGMQGVETYQKHQAEIAIVLSDLGLPILGGQDVFKRIRAINPEVKVIMASGFIDPGAKSDLLKAGVKDFVQKPYSPGELLQTIRAVMETAK